MAFKKTQLEIPDVMLIQTDVYKDNRGVFAEGFKTSAFKELGIDVDIAQIDLSFSTKNVLRGLHYQMNPKAQGKLVLVIEGEIYDVAVDIRKGSPTYGKWVSAKLTSEKLNILYVPVGFAHGFCILSESAKVIYYCSGEYTPEYARAIQWNDPELNIDWPTKDPILSDKDKQNPLFKDAENNFTT